jgi:hypothetical protein
MSPHHTSHPALEDGTDTGFRNVSLPKFDAGEIPRRIHTEKGISLWTPKIAVG